MAALREYPVDQDTTPLTAFEYRQSLFQTVNDRVEDLLDPAQTESWNQIRSIWDPLTEGNRRRVTIGFARADTKDRLLEAWQHHYGFEAGQQGLVSAVADEFMSESRKLLSTYGQTKDSQSPLDADPRQSLSDEFFRLQERMDQRLFANLSEEQRDRLQRQFPVILQFNHSTGFDRDTDRNRGF